MRILIFSLALLLAFSCHAETYHFRVTGTDGSPVANAVIAMGTPGAVHDGRAIMDQKDKQFVPFVLTVAAGTMVSFPNSDQISHQVYSFSSAHPFEIKLYRGKRARPIDFDTPGIIVLGCNIHDNMLGYVYVTTRPTFGKTDITGQLSLSSPNPVHQIEVWHPALSIDAQKQLTLSLDSLDNVNGHYVIRLDIPKQPANPQAISQLRADRFQQFLRH